MNAVILDRAVASKGSLAPRPTEPTHYLTFMLGGETFAICILTIKEIIEYGAVTEVPMMPKCIRGVINLRGAVVPVMDLQARFNRPSADVSKRTCIVIVETGRPDERQVIGVVVDAVNEVIDIMPTDIEPPPAFGARIRSEFILGMGKVRGKFVILLDVDHTFSLEQVQQAGRSELRTASLPAESSAELVE